MIKNKKFFIDKIKHIIFLGESKNLKKLIEINELLKLNSVVVTSSSQKSKITKDIKFFVFNKIDKKFKEFVSKNYKIDQTLFVSLAARYIFKKETIKNFFKNNLVNFHNARLPLDAGGGGHTWKILREDRIDSQTLHLINEKIDQGPIIDNYLSIIPKSLQIPSEIEKFSEKNLQELYKKFIINLKRKKKFDLKYQQIELGRYNPRINSIKNSFINWDISSYDLINFINAFDEPFIGASTFLNRGNFGKLHLKDCQLHGGDSSNHSYMSGIVSRHHKDWIIVSTTGKHMLIVEKVLDSKGKNIINKIKIGDRFITPPKNIFDGNKKRIFYNSKGLKN
jgi:methionyl-tRNA formyltransferase